MKCPECGRLYPVLPAMCGCGYEFKTSKLMLCTDCGKEISRLAPVCPHCGRRMRERSTPAEASGTEKELKHIRFMLGIAFLALFGIPSLIAAITALLDLLFWEDR